MTSARTRLEPEVDSSVQLNELDWSSLDAPALQSAYLSVRSSTEKLVSGLSAEDQNLQSMPEASPVKWHRAHTSWFFETFVLNQHHTGYHCFDPSYGYLFNSYYNGIGKQFPRPQRGLISRPDNATIGRYRSHVDEAMIKLIEGLDPPQLQKLGPLITLGINHEQQHQELIITDLKHAFGHNPLYPAWADPAETAPSTENRQNWVEFKGGLVEIGSQSDRFCFDCETPRHRCYIEDFQLASRPVSCAEFLDFIEDGAYTRSELWLADGWSWIEQNRIRSPLYWHRRDTGWALYTLGGLRAVDPAEPVCHISFHEAFAFAQWAGARLPTEAEWEHAASDCAMEGNFADRERWHPEVPTTRAGLAQMFGNVWEWTSSSYAPYPGFKPAAGAVGEYNGKFMANQMVLRGGSCATAAGHIRPGYRNFFYPVDRWQFSGLRLAKDC